MKVIENSESNPQLDSRTIDHTSEQNNSIPQFISIQEGQFKSNQEQQVTIKDVRFSKNGKR